MRNKSNLLFFVVLHPAVWPRPRAIFARKTGKVSVKPALAKPLSDVFAAFLLRFGRDLERFLYEKQEKSRSNQLLRSRFLTFLRLFCCGLAET